MKRERSVGGSKTLCVSMLAATGLLLACVPALAQEGETITVVAPHKVARKIDRKIVGTTSSGIPIEEISLSHRIGYADLDLTKPADVATLRQRVADVAKASCQDLDKLYPDEADVPLPSNRNCVKAAVQAAMPQVEAAIVDARK